MPLLQVDLFGLGSNVNALLAVIIGVGVAFGLVSRKLTIGAFGGILVFTHIVMNTDLFIYNALLYLLIGVILFAVSFYVIRFYLSDSTEAT